MKSILIFLLTGILLPFSSQAALKAKTIILDVPFIVQAPQQNWKDPRQQQGCEEASILMAFQWGEGKKPFTAPEAEKEIIALALWQSQKYGHSFDTSAEDTAKIMREYFNYQEVKVQHKISSADILKALDAGNLVIVPVNGRKLGNRFYTPPGPLTHMLVIRGYDKKRREFITNDPGTKRGEKFRYKEKVLQGALQDYPTGSTHGLGIKGDTAMIIIEKRKTHASPAKAA
jgi:hypothetical protein